MAVTSSPQQPVVPSRWTVGRKISSIVVACMGLGFAVLIGGQILWEKEEFYTQALNTDLQITKLLAEQMASGVQAKRREDINRAFAALRKDKESDLARLVAQNAAGKPLTTFQSGRFATADFSQAFRLGAEALARNQVFTQKTKDHFIIITPIWNGRDRTRIGTLATAWSLGGVQNRIRSDLIRQVFLAGLALALLVAVNIHLLSRTISRPLEALTLATQHLASGDTKVEVPETQRRDDLGGLARAVEVFKRNVTMIEKMTTEQQKHAMRLKKALEKEREYNVLQREFVSMASHEFRTPLAIIDGAAQRIERRLGRMTQEDLGERVLRIRNAVKRMMSLIDSTLSASRLESGKVDVSFSPCKLADIVEQVCQRQQEISPLHNILVNTVALPESILADPKQLDHIVTNLLSNAVKYAPDNPRIEVTGAQLGDQVVLSFKDYGVGIPEDDLPKLFQRYFRARTATGIAGTGIGLNLVGQLVELHNGRIEVESEEGKGSTFTVFLPLNPDQRPEREAGRESGSGPDPDVAGDKDDPLVAAS